MTILNKTSIKFYDQAMTKKEYARLIARMQKKEFYSVFTIDLTGILSLTADKLSLLVYCKQYAEKNGVHLVLQGVSPTLYAFFELTRMNNFFVLVPSGIS